MLKKINDSLNLLREKYAFGAGSIVETLPGSFALTRSGKENVPLLPWRAERRFIELKKIIDSKTLEDVSTFRFARFTAGGNIEKILEREFDLASYFSGSVINSVFATSNGNKICNAIFRLENGMSGCVECGICLPPGTDVVDKHEIIARRGVACDRMVDTQIPQSSIYAWTASGRQEFTDTDMELFGLSLDEITLVRSAVMLLENPKLENEWKVCAANAVRLTGAALESARSGKKEIL